MAKTRDLLTIYHNINCSKSCNALNALEKSGKEFQVISYLENVPSIDELKAIIKKLNIKPHDLIRTNEAIYLEKFKGKDLTDDEWITAMHENPILIQRPIIMNGDKAAIARTTEQVNAILK